MEGEDGSKEVGHEDIWGKNILDRGKSLEKGPTMRICLVCMKIYITNRLFLQESKIKRMMFESEKQYLNPASSTSQYAVIGPLQTLFRGIIVHPN